MKYIRIAKTKQVNEVLKEIQEFYSLLDDSAIVRMALSKFYTDMKKEAIDTDSHFDC